VGLAESSRIVWLFASEDHADTPSFAFPHMGRSVSLPSTIVHRAERLGIARLSAVPHRAFEVFHARTIARFLEHSKLFLVSPNFLKIGGFCYA
jgi:hypothetical protein